MRPATSLSVSAWDRTRMPSRRTSPSCSSSSLPTNVERSISPLAIPPSFHLSSLVGLTGGRMCDGRFFFTRRRLLDFHHVRGHYHAPTHHAAARVQVRQVLQCPVEQFSTMPNRPPLERRRRR